MLRHVDGGISAIVSSVPSIPGCRMATLSLPLWFVTERKSHVEDGFIPDDDHSMPFMLTHTAPIAKLLEVQKRQWKIAFVEERMELWSIVADLHELGVGSVRINPAADGSGGEWVNLRELMAFCETL
jgi:hypothetical protein